MSGPFTLGGQRVWAHDEGHAAGTFHTFDTLDVSRTFGPRKVHVFLPRRLGPGRRLPTLYQHDGHTAFWPGGVSPHTWDVAGVLDRRRERVPARIVVAVHPVDRDAEYTHVDWFMGRRPFGRLPAHADYLADDLVGFIDAHYPTDPRPAARAVLGSSHGGLAAFWTATHRPDVFGAAGCMSPSFFSGIDSMVDGARPGSLRGSPLLAGVDATLRDRARRPRLWIDWGLVRTGGEHNAIVEALATLRGREMVELLRDEFGYRPVWLTPGESPPPGAELVAMEDPAAGHDERAWQARLGPFLSFVDSPDARPPAA